MGARPSPPGELGSRKFSGLVILFRSIVHDARYQRDEGDAEGLRGASKLGGSF
jgi:hypothetical protein